MSWLDTLLGRKPVQPVAPPGQPPATPVGPPAPVQYGPMPVSRPTYTPPPMPLGGFGSADSTTSIVTPPKLPAGPQLPPAVKNLLIRQKDAITGKSSPGQAMTFGVGEGMKPPQQVAAKATISRLVGQQQADDAAPKTLGQKIMTYPENSIEEAGTKAALIRQATVQMNPKYTGPKYAEADKAMEEQSGMVMGMTGDLEAANILKGLIPKGVGAAAKSAIEELPTKFLPKELSKATPRYNYGSKAFMPVFESDLDKAAYILAQKNPSKREADFLEHAMNASGLSEAELRAHGQDVKGAIKIMARDAEPGDLNIPKLTPKALAQKAETAVTEKAPSLESAAIHEPAPAPTLPELPVESEGSLPRKTELPELSPESPVESPSMSGEPLPRTSENPNQVTYTPNETQYGSIVKVINESGLPKEAKVAAKQGVADAEAAASELKGRPITFKEIQAESEKTNKMLEGLTGRDETLDQQVRLLNTRRAMLQMAAEGKTQTVEYAKLAVQQRAALTDVARILGSARVQPSEKPILENLVNALTKEADKTDDIIRAMEDPKYKVGLDSDDAATRLAAQKQFFNDNVHSSFGSWLQTVRYNSMLSSPVTQARSLLGNLVGMAYSPAVKLTAGATDAVRSAIFGGERTQFATEAGSFVKGIADRQAIKSAWSNFVETLKPTGHFAERLESSPWELPFTKQGTLARGTENTLRFPTRLLDAADRFVMTISKAGEKAALETRQGLGGKIAGTIDEEAEKASRYWASRNKPLEEGQGKVLNAIDHTTNLIRNARNSPSKFVKTVADFTVPFLNITTNELKKGLEFSPLGFSTMVGAANKSEQFAKAAIGTMTALGLGTMIAGDKITGSLPRSTKDRDRWTAAGIQPWSVRVGDKWVSYQNLPGELSYTMAFLANTKQAREDGVLSEKGMTEMLKAFAKQAQFVSSQSYTQGIGNLVDALNSDDPNKYAKIVSGYGQQLIPFRAFGSWMNGLIDQYQRSPDPKAGVIQKQWQYLEAQIPGLSQAIPARVDPFTGAPLQKVGWEENPGARFLKSLSPAKISNERVGRADMLRESDAKAKELAPLVEEQAAQVDESKAEVKQLYNELSKLDPDEANQRAAELDSVTRSKLKAYAKNQGKEPVSVVDEQYKTLGVESGIRSRAIWGDLMKLGSDDERNSRITELQDAGIISKPVLYQIAARKVLKDLEQYTTPEEKNAAVAGMDLDSGIVDALKIIVKHEQKTPAQ